MAQNSGCWISFVHYARVNAGSKAKIVEIHVILGRNVQILWNFLADLPSSGVKGSPSMEFPGFPSTKDKARGFVSVSIDKWIRTIKMHNQRD